MFIYLYPPKQGFPTFLVPGIGFMETIFPWTGGKDGFACNIDPTHMQMKLHSLFCGLFGLVPKRPWTGILIPVVARELATPVPKDTDNDLITSFD